MNSWLWMELAAKWRSRWAWKSRFLAALNAASIITCWMVFNSSDRWVEQPALPYLFLGSLVASCVLPLLILMTLLPQLALFGVFSEANRDFLESLLITNLRPVEIVAARALALGGILLPLPFLYLPVLPLFLPSLGTSFVEVFALMVLISVWGCSAILLMSMNVGRLINSISNWQGLLGLALGISMIALIALPFFAVSLGYAKGTSFGVSLVVNLLLFGWGSIAALSDGRMGDSKPFSMVPVAQNTGKSLAQYPINRLLATRMRWLLNRWPLFWLALRTGQRADPFVLFTVKRDPDRDAPIRSLPFSGRDVVANEMIQMIFSFLLVSMIVTILLLLGFAVHVMVFVADGFQFGWKSAWSFGEYFVIGQIFMKMWPTLMDYLVLVILTVLGGMIYRTAPHSKSLERFVLAFVIMLELIGIWMSLIYLSEEMGFLFRLCIHALLIGSLLWIIKRRVESGEEFELSKGEFFRKDASGFGASPDHPFPTARKSFSRHLLPPPWLAVILALLACSLGFRWHLTRQIEICRVEWSARGLPVTIEEVSRLHKEPPDDQNAALAVLGAADWISPLGSDLEFSNADRKWWYDSTQPPPTPWLKAAEKYVRANAKGLELAARAANLEQSRYPIELNPILFSYPSWFQKFRRTQQLIHVDIWYRVGTGDVENALRSLEASFGVVRSLGKESRLGFFSIHHNSAATGILAARRLLCLRQLNRRQLERLRKAVDGAGIETGWNHALVGEMVRQRNWFYNFTVPEFIQIMSSGGKIPNSILFFYHVEIALYHVSGMRELFYLSAMERDSKILDLSKLAEPFSLNEIRAMDEKEISGGLPLRILFMFRWMMRPSFEGFFRNHLDYLAKSRSLRTALAIEGYRLDHKRLPDELGQLVPGYLGHAPRDPFDGKPLRFKKLERGYAIYSVGTNGRDDGGEESSGGDYNPADIVFAVTR